MIFGQGTLKMKENLYQNNMKVQQIVGKVIRCMALSSATSEVVHQHLELEANHLTMMGFMSL